MVFKETFVHLWLMNWKRKLNWLWKLQHHRGGSIPDGLSCSIPGFCLPAVCVFSLFQNQKAYMEMNSFLFNSSVAKATVNYYSDRNLFDVIQSLHIKSTRYRVTTRISKWNKFLANYGSLSQPRSVSDFSEPRAIAEVPPMPKLTEFIQFSQPAESNWIKPRTEHTFWLPWHYIQWRPGAVLPSRNAILGRSRWTRSGRPIRGSSSAEIHPTLVNYWLLVHVRKKRLTKIPHVPSLKPK